MPWKARSSRAPNAAASCWNFTANIQSCLEQLVPADAIYAGRCLVDGTPWPAAVSIGTNPTFGDNPRTVEAHLIGFEANLYGRTLRLELLGPNWRRSRRSLGAGVELPSSPASPRTSARPSRASASTPHSRSAKSPDPPASPDVSNVSSQNVPSQNVPSQNVPSRNVRNVPLSHESETFLRLRILVLPPGVGGPPTFRIQPSVTQHSAFVPPGLAAGPWPIVAHKSAKNTPKPAKSSHLSYFCVRRETRQGKKRPPLPKDGGPGWKPGGSE